MDGIICVYKPKNYTSFDVVAVMRRLCRTKKIGHGGTLDPMAEGVLPIFIGAATKAADYMPSGDKEYLAGFKFGLVTDTQDITGKIISQNDTYVSRNKMVLVERYKGKIEQIPPMFSAVQKDGVRLYELARKGKTVERAARTVSIYDIKVEEYRDNEGLLRIRCSRGTYIRTLIHDIGQEIGAGAVMTSLVRVKSGTFTLDDCHTVEELQDGVLKEGVPFVERRMSSLKDIFKCYPSAYLDSRQSYLFGNGATLDANRVKFDRIYDGIYTVYDVNLSLAALAKISRDHSLAVIQRFQASPLKIAKGTKPNLEDA